MSTTVEAPTKRFISTREFAALINRTPDAIAKMLARGEDLPIRYKFGGDERNAHLSWDLADVERWIESRRVG